MLKNDRYIKAALSQPVDMTPVWMMRQAGRYLPEYRELRAEAGDFMSLCTNPELACEVTLQPLRRYELDAAILFSDILTIPDAMGLGLYFKSGEGPAFKQAVKTESDVKKLYVPDIYEKLRYVTDAVTLIRKELKGEVPLIGFSGSPWTLATYMVEGGTTKNFGEVKGMMFSQPKVMHELLDVLAKSVIAYLNAQIESGAQAVMLFDTWGGVLSTANYREFSLNYMQQIIDGLKRNHDGQQIPVTLFTKGGAGWLEMMVESGADCLGLDWTIDIDEARSRVGEKVALQGNMDPCVLYSTPERIEAEVGDILSKFGSGNGHVFNLGHGIHPTIAPENVKAYVDAVHRLSVQYHS
ncbi:uroporphyrinogen decarboxylase [Aliikangiella sp. G2MR2-5]|uniref:uroporphyrinogen decarboxylase n=1 Tax=Aliikangiella sp. G2MR2-5 TaxID=2788943 RepID=UPI0018A97FEC|nr:uroporphyrinogen decarboxylase [Aliikangiella sp. G2MR2-5]